MLAHSRRPIAALMMLAATAALPAPARALDDAQKKEIGAFIKEYLIANPEIMLEVQSALKAKQMAEQEKLATAAISDNEQAIFHSAYDVTLGNPDGDVTVVEFYDYNCGYCKRALSDMDMILQTDKNVRFVLKELPILGPTRLPPIASPPPSAGSPRRSMAISTVRCSAERIAPTRRSRLPLRGASVSRKQICAS